MRIMSRVTVAVTATGLVLSLIVSGGTMVAGAATTSGSVGLARSDTAAPMVAGFGTSPGRSQDVALSACSKGNHYDDATIT